MIVSSGYRKNGFDAHGGKLFQKKDMDFWMNLPERTDRVPSIRKEGKNG